MIQKLVALAQPGVGTWGETLSVAHHHRSDGYEAPVTLGATLTIGEEAIEVDFAGTSGLSSRGINVPAAYCRAYASFGIKVVVAPEIPRTPESPVAPKAPKPPMPPLKVEHQ